MTTTIIPVIVPASTTKTAYFIGTTAAGRKMRIEVTAAADMEETAILDDLRRSSLQECKREDQGSLGWGLALSVFTLAMVVVWGIGMVSMMVMDVAGWLDAYGPWRWPSFLPVVGDYGLWKGLLRIWTLLWPIGFVGISIGYAISSRRDPTHVS